MSFNALSIDKNAEKTYLVMIGESNNCRGNSVSKIIGNDIGLVILNNNNKFLTFE